MSRRATIGLAALALLLLAGCAVEGKPEEGSLVLATTTSTRDSGLLDELLPHFERESGIEVKVVAVGSGQALELGRRGDADVLMTHAPAAEEVYVEEGHAVSKRSVMANEFLLVGPPDDPAGLREESSVLEALARLVREEARFVSRGDDSGTHRKELSLWRRADLEPSWEGYVQAGAGMADALRMADELSAYTLSDIATFLAHREHLDLEVALEGDPLLANPYSVMLVNPERHPHVAEEEGRRFIAWLLAEETQERIARFGCERYGRPLFHTLGGADRSNPCARAE